MALLNTTRVTGSLVVHPGPVTCEGGFIGNITVDSSSFATYSVTSSYALNSAQSVHIEKGIISGSLFGGNPMTSSIYFNLPFESSIYTISVVGEDLRGWSISERSATGFVVNSNSNKALTGMVFWRAEEI